MKFTLKRISYSSRLSQETNAFAADVYIDGKKAGIAENAGHGGSTDVHLIHLTPDERKKVMEWVRSQPPKVYPASEEMDSFSIPMDLDVIVDDLLSEYLDEKYGETAQKKKWCKKAVMFRLTGDEVGVYRSIKKENGVYTKRLKEFLVKKYGDKIEEILNETFGEISI
jgi:hypothetical protein